MIRTLAISVVLALAGATAVSAVDDAPQYCCACVAGELAQSSGAFNGTATTANFCIATDDGAAAEAAAERCKEQTGHKLLCIACVAGGNTTCREDLAGTGILCPTSPAPAAGGASLLALAVVLGAAGAFVLRRNRRHPRGPVH